MAAGVIIGRVAVKVIPDTSDFKENLERDLDRIEKSLDSIDIKIDVDTDTVVREAKKARQKAQDQMKDLRLKVNLDSEESIKRSLGQLNREIERLGEVNIDVDLNEDDLREKLDLLSEQLEAIRTIDIEVNKVDPNSISKAVDTLNRELDKIKNIEIEKVTLNESALTDMRDRLRDKMDETYRQIRENVGRQLATIQIGMDVDPIQAARTIRKIEVLLEAIEDAKMTITSDMDERTRFATLRKIQDMKDQVEDMKATIHPDLDEAALPGLRARLAALARDRYVEYVPRVNRAAANAVGMALARMSGARLIGGYMQDIYRGIVQFDKAVPKVIALSLAVAGLGVSGLAATSNLFALSASLASIAPAALALPGLLAGIGIGVGVMVAALKDFPKVFPDVEKAFQNMQDSISNNFWAQAEKPMRKMLDGILPALAKGFDKTATRIGSFFANLSSATDRILTPKLGTMFERLASSITIASRAADPLVNIITTFGTIGSAYLERLAGWFEKITRQFSNFLVLNERSGNVYEWIDAGIIALKDLARVGKNAALILYDIAQAAQAAGGSSLGALADGLGRIREITSSPAFQGGLREVFEAAHTAMQNIVLISGPAVAGLFETIGNLATTILPIVGTAIGTVVREIATALSQPEVTEGITSMFTGIMAGIDALVPAFDPLARAFATFGPLVGDLARNLGEVLGAAIPPIADGLVRIGDAVAPLIPMMGEALLTAVEALAPVFENLAGAIASMLENGGVSVIGGTFQLMADGLNAIPEDVLTAIVGGFGLLAIGISATNTALKVFNIVAGIATGVIRGLGIAIAIATSPITLIIIAIAAMIAWGYLVIKNWDLIKATASVAWTFIKNKVADAVEAMRIVVKSKWEEIKTNTSAAWEAVKVLISAKIDQAKTAVVMKFGEMVTSVRTKFDEMKTAISSKIDTIKTGISVGFEAAKTVAKQKFAEMATAVTMKLAEVVTSVRGLPGRIQAALGSLGGLLVGAGRAVIDGFIDGLTAGFGRVQSTLSRLTSMLPDWKGPAQRDATILTEAGRLVMGGFIDGLESQYDAVRSSLRGLTEDLADSFGDPITANLKADVSKNLPNSGVRKGLVGSVRTAVSEQQSIAAGKTLIYHAAPGSSLGAEEDLFAAADRGRMVGW